MNIAEKMGAGKYAPFLMIAAERWGISNPEDQARWLAQCSVESQGFTKVKEDLRYRAERLLQVFPGRNGLRTIDMARRIVQGGQSAIAEHIYGGAWGAKNLGNTEPGDGAKFFGRGLKQITGRYNYRMTSIGMYGDERLLDNPELLEQPRDASESAAYYWYSHKLNGRTSVREITKIVNGGYNGLDDRETLTAQALQFVRAT